MINKMKTAVINRFANSQGLGINGEKIKLVFAEKQDIRNITAYKKSKLCCLELAEKISSNTADEKEKQKYISAREYIYKYETLAKLPDRVTHDRLFEVYPQLKSVNFYFDKIPANSAYYPRQNAIVINPTRSRAKQRKSLICEIQNAIEYIDGLSIAERQND